MDSAKRRRFYFEEDAFQLFMFHLAIRALSHLCFSKGEADDALAPSLSAKKQSAQMRNVQQSQLTLKALLPQADKNVMN